MPDNRPYSKPFGKGNYSDKEDAMSLSDDPSLDEREIIASTYPPDLGDPQVLFTSIEGVAEFLLISCVGLEPTRPQHARTPARFVRALRELTTSDDNWEFTTFDTISDEMVIIRDIQFASLCEHHVLPFFGVCHVAYVPNGKLAGLSKIPRLVKQCSAMLNTQEDLTAYIANRLDTLLEPRGVGVVMEARHTCMEIRGAQAAGALTYTAAMHGVFSDHTRTAKAEFMSRINGAR